MSWDKKLPSPLCAESKVICDALRNSNHIEFPRFVVQPLSTDLHVFCDASERAFGAVAYAVCTQLRMSNLLTSKVRVSPQPRLTIPRLELTAIDLCVKLAHSLLNNPHLGLSSCTIWSDSEVAICWVTNNKSTIPYVRNRVQAIRESEFTIFHVPTGTNPADLLTRGLSADKLKANDLWIHGPKFLLTKDYPFQKDFVSTGIEFTL